MKTKKEIAEIIGIKKSCISNFLKGRYRVNYDRAIEISTITGIQVAILQSRSGTAILSAFEDRYGKINAGPGRPRVFRENSS